MNRNARMGLIFFAVYATVYSVFVMLNAFFPSTMDWSVMPGLNLAIVYGLGLIGLAFLMAMLYGWLCSTGTPDDSTKGRLADGSDGEIGGGSIEARR